LEEKLADDGDTIEDFVEKKSDITRLRGKLGVLNGRERQIIELRYGLRGGREITQREIAKRLGISRSYVSRIEKRALEKLRAELFEN
jgi:RNA polymerase sporulation-specific sigma factor